MTDHIIAPYSDWFEAHKSHLAKEKALTRQRQQLAAERRALPWLRIENGPSHTLGDWVRLHDEYDGR